MYLFGWKGYGEPAVRMVGTKDRLKLARRRKLPHSGRCNMASMHADLCLDLHTQTSQISDVHADGGNVETESRYNGRSIHLWSTRKDEETWVCEYTIVELRPTYSFSESGYPIGSFATRDEAEAAALEVAHGVIDARDPVGGPIIGSVLAYPGMSRH
jgi:hypothetical protein